MQLTEAQVNTINEVATKAAHRFARRVFWADVDDLKQEALTVAVKAFKGFDRAVGVDLEAYLWIVCVRQLGKYCWRNSAPVSEAEHQLRNLKGVHRAALDTKQELLFTSGTGSLHPNLVAKERTDALLEEKQWTEAVRAQVDYLLEQYTPEERKVAVNVIVHKQQPRVVARRSGRKVTEVYRIARRAKTALAENLLLYELWKEI